MESNGRKKSTSSDSELSDSWTLMDHPDNCIVPGTNLSTEFPVENTINCNIPSLVVGEETSDAESVEIIHDGDVFDGIDHKDVFTPVINRITEYEKGESDSSSKEEGIMLIPPYNNPIKKTDSKKYLLKELIEIILLFSVIGVVLLTASFTVLFVQEHLISWGPSGSNGLDRADSELSSLLTDLNTYQQENERLKNQIKELYNGWRRLPIPTTEEVQPIVQPPTESVVNEVEVINKNPFVNDRKNDKEFFYDTPSSRHVFHNADDNFSKHEEKITNLIHFLGNVSAYPGFQNVTNPIESLQNINHHLKNLALVIKNLEISKESNPLIKTTEIVKIQKKLANFFFKVEGDFMKVVSKLSKRLGKMHSEFFRRLCFAVEDHESYNHFGCDNQKNLNYKKEVIEMKAENGKNELPGNYKSKGYKNSRKYYVENSIKKGEYKSYYKKMDPILYKKPERNNLESGNIVFGNSNTIDNVESQPEIPLYINEGKDRRSGDKMKKISKKHKRSAQKARDRITNMTSNLDRACCGTSKDFEEKNLIFDSNFIMKRQTTIQKENESDRKKMNNRAEMNENNLKKNDGQWFLELGEARSKKRFNQGRSDWLFERERARALLRDQAKWAFDRASLRQFCRSNSQSSWCL